MRISYWCSDVCSSYLGNRFNIVCGPTQEIGGFPFELEDGSKFPYGGLFNPGVIASYDGDWNITGYAENLGGPGTKYIAYGDNYPWDFMRAATFDASYIKLREISLGYELPMKDRKSTRLNSSH